MPEARFRNWVEISLGRIVANFRAVRELVGPETEICPVVKADAYRHGAVEITRALVGAGAGWFAVSCAEEGVALRRAGIDARILVLADFLPFSRRALVDHGLTPVLHDLDDIAAWDACAASTGRPLPYHLKIDTGMSRLGTLAAPAEIAQAVAAARHARLEGLMTHFASAADYISDQTGQQYARFCKAIEGLHTRGVAPPLVHLASTIAVAYGRRESWRTLVRPGHAIYGYVSPVRVRPGNRAPGNALQVEPALTWKAALVLVKDIPAGAAVGYGAMFRAPRPMRVGVVAAGYADGVPHRLSNRGRLIAGGQFAPVLGAVSMDLTTIDLSAAPHLKAGDAVTIIGREGDAAQDAQQLARMAGTISYSLLCGISPRVERVYTG